MGSLYHIASLAQFLKGGEGRIECLFSMQHAPGLIPSTVTIIVPSWSARHGYPAKICLRKAKKYFLKITSKSIVLSFLLNKPDRVVRTSQHRSILWCSVRAENRKPVPFLNLTDFQAAKSPSPDVPRSPDYKLLFQTFRRLVRSIPSPSTIPGVQHLNPVPLLPEPAGFPDPPIRGFLKTH